MRVECIHVVDVIWLHLVMENALEMPEENLEIFVKQNRRKKVRSDNLEVVLNYVRDCVFLKVRMGEKNRFGNYWDEANVRYD